jgi:hypothetical protein
LTRAQLKTPKAAAIAGIVFSALLTLTFVLLRLSVPADPLERGGWLTTSVKSVTIAINLIPFAGIAFLWFLGVLRDRLGATEDRFFATVFFGSGLLFLSTLFCGAALAGSLLLAFADAREDVAGSPAFLFARAAAYNLVNVYAAKMAAVFMVSTSTIVLYTQFIPRWIAIAGLGGALTMLLGSQQMTWSFLVLPAWVLTVSCYIFWDNLGARGQAAQGAEAPTP